VTLIERATKSANSVANQTVSTVSDIGTAVAEGVVVATKDIRTGMQEGRIRPATVVVAGAIGLITLVEWPLIVAAGGAYVVVRKLRNRPTEEPEEAEVLDEIEAPEEVEAPDAIDAPEEVEAHDETESPV
jgi:hypothetical protein